MTHDLRTDSADAAAQPIACANPDAPVRIDVAMPRGLYDRLADHDEAPRSRCDMTTGRAEFVAAPGVSREWRAWKLSASVRADLDRLPASRTPRNASRRARDIARRIMHAMLGADHRDPVDPR